MAEGVLLDELRRRMKRIEGQVRGIQRLLDEGAACEAIVLQVSAVRAALNKVGLKVVACQLGEKMAAEIRNGGTGKEASEEMAETFRHLS